ncbi:solute carrier family 22 member 3-like [Haliotis asinina]|uniref:solute carrier family 22 member 3-like n=1 Tax=Haliotis asinina TaxID=109174 RepID=UPI003531FE5D
MARASTIPLEFNVKREAAILAPSSKHYGAPEGCETVKHAALQQELVSCKSVTHQCATLSPQSITDILTSLGIPAVDVVGIDTNYYKCSVDVTINTLASSQTVEVGCLDGQDFGDMLFVSVISEFDLVCDRRVLGVLPKIVLIAAQAVGALTLPVLADYVGRKPILIAAQALSLMLGIALAFTRNIEQFLVLKALSGVFVDGAHLISFTMALELTLERDRNIVEESIRWLFAEDRNEEALQLLIQAAEINHVDTNTILRLYYGHTKTPKSDEGNETVNSIGVDEETTSPTAAVEPSRSTPTSEGTDTAETSSSIEQPKDGTSSPERVGASTAAVTTTSSADNTTPAETPSTTGPGTATSSSRGRLVKAEEPESRGCLGIIRDRRLLIQTVIFAYVWSAVGFSFLSLYLAETVLADSLYLNFSVNVLSELPAGIIFLLVVDRIGRKNTMFLFFGTALAFLFACTLVKVLAGRAVDLTKLIGLGISSLAAKFGNLGAPFVFFFEDTIPWLPTALIVILLLIATLAILPLPETKGNDLPESVIDGANIYEN